MRRFDCGPAPLAPSLMSEFDSMSVKDPTIKKMARAVITGIRYMLSFAYTLAAFVLATLSKNFNPKGVCINIKGNLNSALIRFCVCKH